MTNLSKVERFDLGSPEFKQDPNAVFAQMRKAGPLVRGKLPIIGSTWLVTTHEGVTDLLKNKDDFALNAKNAGRKSIPGLKWWMPRAFRTLASNMLTSDDPDHKRLRGLVDQAFLRANLEAMTGRVEAICDEFLDQLSERLREEPDEGVNFLEVFARPFPLTVICELLGLPLEDRPKFAKWVGGLTNSTKPLGMLWGARHIGKLLRYLEDQFEQCRKEPRAGLMSALVEAEQEGEKLSEDELLSMTFLLLLAGHETTVHLLTSGLYSLLTHPLEKEKVLSDWSYGGTMVDELLRYATPVLMTKPRYVKRDLQFHGEDLKQGEYVIALLGSANRDPEKFDSPETFDITRKPNPHVSFGGGVHFCLGFQLAKMEVQVAMRRLFERYPDLALAHPDAEPNWSTRIGWRALQSLEVIEERNEP